jgi:hypothetical protein
MEPLAVQIVESTPATIRRLTSELTDAQAHFRPAPGEWSIVEIVGHLIDKTESWGERMRRIAVEDAPFLPGFDQDEYVQQRGYQQRTLADLLPRLEELQWTLVADLRRLPAQAWQRSGVHGERGQLTLGEACRIYAISLPDHVSQVIATRDQAFRGGAG